MCGGMWDQFASFIIRPPRTTYQIKDLGPRRFQIDGFHFHRTDLTLRNRRGLLLQCSHFEPLPECRPQAQLPCVIYCHGNSGCRLEALDGVASLCPLGITIFSFDFAGCGLSEGETITLADREVDDLGCVVEHLRKEGRTSGIGLWGRSMGAATSLIYAARDPSIAGMVLDSPFADLNALINELAKNYKVPVPKIFIGAAIGVLRWTVKGRNGLDIKKLRPCAAASHCFVPLLMGHAQADSLINFTHSLRIMKTYGGEKELIRLPGDHNSERPQYFVDKVIRFWRNVFRHAGLMDLRPPGQGHPAEVGFATVEDLEEEQLRQAIYLSLRQAQQTPEPVDPSRLYPPPSPRSSSASHGTQSLRHEDPSPTHSTHSSHSSTSSSSASTTRATAHRSPPGSSSEEPCVPLQHTSQHQSQPSQSHTHAHAQSRAQQHQQQQWEALPPLSASAAFPPSAHEQPVHVSPPPQLSPPPPTGAAQRLLAAMLHVESPSQTQSQTAEGAPP